MQGVFLQVKSLVYGTQAPYGLLLSRHELNQMQCIQVYNKHEVWLKQTTIPLIATTNTSVYPKQIKEVILKLDLTSQKLHIEGRSVSWIVTEQLGFPLQPIVTDFVANTTTVSYINNTQKVQKLHKGETLGYLDLRSKDGSLTHLQWLVPLNKSKDQYTLYGHTAFVNALAQQSLAEETDNQQKTNRLEIRQRPFRVKKADMKPDQDPYPWLDKEDPHRFRTDDELIESKIDLSDSVLNKEERNEVMNMLKQKKDTFSLRDEIGTCPYFEVKLQLRDDTPFFVRPYPIREEQKAIV